MHGCKWPINCTRTRTEYNETEKPKISITFELDRSGMLTVSKAEAKVESYTEEKVEIKKNVTTENATDDNATDGANATDDAGEEEESAEEAADEAEKADAGNNPYCAHQKCR